MNKKLIGIFTTFADMQPSYSLCSVVLDQLHMLVKYNYKPVLFVLPNFKDEGLVPKGVEVRKVVPQLILEPYKELSYPDHWKEDVQKVKDMCEKNLQDIDILICHDIFFIDTYLPYNIGLREAKIKCNFLAWTHSAPSTRPELTDNPHANRFHPIPRGKLVYLNHDKALKLAEMYGCWLKDVRTVHNSRDPRTFWGLSNFTIQLIDKYSILDADIISTYPLSTPRMLGAGKRLEVVIKLHSKLKELGYKTRLIVPNAHANAQRDQTAIANTQVFAQEQGLESGDLIFTSQEDEKYLQGVPGHIVSELFRLSNIFIFPTTSENSSLVLAEAMCSGNLLVLNSKVGTLREHAGEKALYFDFDYRDKKEENENYYLDLAKIIASEFEQDRALQAKKRVFQKQNYDYVFTKLIEPLFYEYE